MKVSHEGPRENTASSSTVSMQEKQTKATESTTAQRLTFKDLFLEYNQKFVLVQAAKDESEKAAKDEPHTMFMLSLMEGRPIWQAHFYGLEKNKSSLEFALTLLELAKTKLLNGRQSEHVTDKQALAVLGCRSSLSFTSFSQYPKDLVASHFATCFYVDELDRRLLCGYPSEPVLCEAAAHILAAPKIYMESLHHLHEALINGVVEASVRGELVCKLILLRAWDKAVVHHHKSNNCATRHIFYTRAMKTEQFLESLLHNAAIEIIKSQVTAAKYRQFTSGLVSFTHFVYTVRTLAMHELSLFFFRKAAVFCKRNQKAVDLIIPVLLEDGSFTAIIVQCRNYAGSDQKMSLAMENQTLEEAQLLPTAATRVPYLTLYMQIGTGYAAKARDLKASNTIEKVKMQLEQAEKSLASALSDERLARHREARQVTVDQLRAQISNFEARLDPNQMILGLTGISSSVYKCISEPGEEQILQRVADAFLDPVKMLHEKIQQHRQKVRDDKEVASCREVREITGIQHTTSISYTSFGPLAINRYGPPKKTDMSTSKSG